MAKKLTHNEYVVRVHAIQPSWDVVTAYLGLNRKVVFQEKTTGIRWTAFAKAPLQGTTSAPKPGSKRSKFHEAALNRQDHCFEPDPDTGSVYIPKNFIAHQHTPAINPSTATVTGRIPSAPETQEIPNDREIPKEIPGELVNVDFSEIEQRTIAHLQSPDEADAYVSKGEAEAYFVKSEQEQFEEDLHKAHPELVLTGKYTNRKLKVTIQHEDGRKKRMLPNAAITKGFPAVA